MKPTPKHLLAVLCSLFVTTSSLSCLSPPDAAENSKPPIRTVITHLSSSSDNPNEDSEGRWQRLTYDRHGHVLENDGSYLPQEDGTLELEYDEDGNIIKSNWYDSDGSLQRTNTFRYDSCGNVIEIATSMSTYWIGHTDGNGKLIIEYDSSGNVLKQSTYSTDNDLTGFTVNTYDGMGNLTERVSYDFEGVATSRKAHSYDDKGNRIETSSYGRKGQLTWKTVNVYDDHGNLIESRGYEPDGSLAGKETYEYDPLGNVIKQTQYGSYDDYSVWATAATTYLEFDEYGNWTKRAGSGTSRIGENGEVQEESGEYVEYRTITYYARTPDCKKGTLSSITQTPTPEPTPTATTTSIPEVKAYVVYEADLSHTDDPAKVMKGLITVLENRLKAYGITKPCIAQVGSNHLKVSLTGISGNDLEEAATLLGEPALIKFKEFQPMNPNNDGTSSASLSEDGSFYFAYRTDNEGKEELAQVPRDEAEYIAIPAGGTVDGQEKELTSLYLKGKVEVAISQGGPVIYFTWDDEGAEMFEQITRRLLYKPLGIFLGDAFISAPTVQSVITDSGQITGLDLNEAKRLARLLNAGRLEVPLAIVETSGF